METSQISIVLRCMTVCFYLQLTLINCINIVTPQGEIMGVAMKTANGRSFSGFLGIPYAKPPVGELRFKEPVPYGNWSGVFDGSKESPRCTQPQSFMGTYTDDPIIGQEDCLYVNVFTPETSEKKKYPVMVWIHGGVFVFGSAALNAFGPLYLLDKNIVLVSFHYRLGFLGLASSGDGEIGENLALKDQNTVLKWVRDNVVAYGGNADNVTIFGHSAGGASVHFHLVSPLSQGLFHRAIIMSGSADAWWTTMSVELATQHTKEIASLVNCTTNNTTEMTECLRNVSSYDLVATVNSMKVWDIDPVNYFRIIIEPTDREGAFLIEDPHNVVFSIPLIIGLVKDDGAIRTILFSSGPNGLDKSLSDLNEKFNEIAPVSLGYGYTAPDPDSVSNQIRNFYFGNKTISRDTLQEVINMYTDNYLFHNSVTALRNSQDGAYFYLFTQYSNNFLYSYFISRPENHAVAHGDDLKYLFPMNYTNTYVEETEEDKLLREKMVKMWTNFAINGNPTDGLNIRWEKTSSDATVYLQIELNNFQTGSNLWSERLAFWDQLEFE